MPPVDLSALIVAAVTGITSAGGSWAAMRVTLAYMKRDIQRAQNTADGAHGRIDSLLGWPGGKRSYDPARRDDDVSLTR